MQYRINDNNVENNIYDTQQGIIETFLKNRGVSDAERYMNLTNEVTNDYHLLDNVEDAVEIFNNVYEQAGHISILVDEDPDGYTSAAMIYLYIKQMNPDYPVRYIMHERAKAHGLTDDVEIPDDTELLIIADAGTNDADACKKLVDKGVKIIILDHHEKEVDNPYATIVNNQMSKNYPNKDFCGAGIVYKFLQALDEYYWQEYADDYLDLVALGNISDVMDMRSEETRFYTDLGLLNVKNKCLDALIKAQEYCIKGKVNIHNVQWYITPILNGCIRFGSLEEKELLFKAFIEQDEFFKYKKKATKDKPAEIIQESIYDRAARLCKNAKARQDKAKDKAVDEIIGQIHIDEGDKVVIFDTTEIMDSSLTGVVAIKIAEHFNRPCILLQRFSSDFYGGSARNVDHSPILSFKDVVNQITLLSGKGHANAFGIVDLRIEDLDETRIRMNKLLKDVVYDSTYIVDYILNSDDVSLSFVINMSMMEDLLAQGIDEPIIAVENIHLHKNDFEIFGKNSDTISFVINDVKFIMFKCKTGNKLYDWLQDAWEEDDEITFTIVGTPGINEYNGVKTPQITIKDVEVLENNTVEEDFEW